MAALRAGRSQGLHSAFFAIDVRKQLAKIVVSIYPGSAVEVKDAIDRIGFWTDREIKQSDIAVNQDAIVRADHRSLVAFDHDALAWKRHRPSLVPRPQPNI
jgi:hypothetical protein